MTPVPGPHRDLRVSVQAALAGLIAAVALLGVGGCASQQEKYCDTVKEHQKELGKLAADDSPDASLKALPSLEEIADDAPSDIKDEWQTVLNALRALDQAFEETGADPATYDPKHPPSDVTRAEQRRIAEAAGDLRKKQVLLAVAGLDQESRDVCKTPLGLG